MGLNEPFVRLIFFNLANAVLVLFCGLVLGVCSSKADKLQARKNRQIGKFIDSRKYESELVYKLLLLGAGESGKCTQCFDFDVTCLCIVRRGI